MIDICKIEDLYDILEALEEYNKDVSYSPWDINSATVSVENLIKNDNVGFYKSVDNQGKIDGLGCVLVVPQILDYTENKAIEAIFHSKHYRILYKLLKEMEIFAKSKKAKTISFSINTRNTMQKFLEKNGYKLNEIVMIKEV